MWLVLAAFCLAYAGALAVLLYYTAQIRRLMREHDRETVSGTCLSQNDPAAATAARSGSTPATAGATDADLSNVNWWITTEDPRDIEGTIALGRRSEP